MGSQQALFTGASIGLAIAAPIGPMALIVIRRTLTSGFFAGITTGAGASTVNLVYAALALGGLDQIATHVQGNRKLLNVVIALVLLLLAIRTLRKRVATAEAAPRLGGSLFGNYASAIAFNLVNPMGFALLLGAVAAISGLPSNDVGQACSVAVGVFTGSIAWWTVLVATTSFIGVRLSPRSIRLIDITAGTIMIALAASALSRVV